MQEGIDKIKETVVAAIAAREEAEKANEKKKRALKRLQKDYEFELGLSGSIMDTIQEMEKEILDAEEKAAVASAKVEAQRTLIKEEGQAAEEEMEKKKEVVRQAMAAQRDEEEKNENREQHLLLTASHAEKEVLGLKMEMKDLKEEIDRIQSTAARRLKEKKEMWTIVNEMRERTHIENEATLNYRSYCKPVLPKQYA